MKIRHMIFLLLAASLSFADVAPAAITPPTADVLGNLIPKIDPQLAFIAVLGIIVGFIFLILGGIFIFAVLKNWIVLKWPYKITRFRPSGGIPMRVDDFGALITNDKGKMFLRMKSTGINHEVPDRTYIQPGDYIYGWSTNIREFTPMKVNFIALMGKADPGVINKIMQCKDETQRNNLLEAYQDKLKDYSINYRPVVSNSAINSAIDSAAEIVENSPKKIDFLPWIVAGGSVIVMLIAFLIAGMMTMKGYDQGVEIAKTDGIRASADLALAQTLNQSNIVNNKLANILEKQSVNILTGGT